MIKRLSLILLVAAPVVYADWKDELSLFVDLKERKLDFLRAEAAVQHLLDDDLEAVKKYDEESENKDTSLLGKVVGLARWGKSKVDATYHQRVLDFIRGLPDNKKDHDGLVSDLIHLLRRNEELALLKEECDAAQSWKEKTTLRSYIIAKEAQIRTRKALIEARITLS